MIKSINKDKIPKGFGYVLRSSQLDTLLQEHKIEIHTDLTYRFSNQSVGCMFEVFFWLPNHNVAYERLYVRAGVVKKDDLSAARAVLEHNVLPAFLDWVIAILNAPDNSPIKQHNKRFAAVYNNGRLVINN